jgi:hypothetical protein
MRFAGLRSKRQLPVEPAASAGPQDAQVSGDRVPNKATAPMAPCPTVDRLLMATAAAPVASSASTELLMAEKLDGDVPPPAKRHKFQEPLRGAMAELDKEKEKEQQDHLPSVAPSSLIEEDWEAGMLVVPQNELVVPQNELAAGQGASIEEEWAVERIIQKRSAVACEASIAMSFVDV